MYPCAPPENACLRSPGFGFSLPKCFGLHPSHRIDELRSREHLRQSISEKQRAFPPIPLALRPHAGSYYGLCWLLAPTQHRRPFGHKARSPQVRTHSFTAQPPDLRRFALITRASRNHARSPCSATPSIRIWTPPRLQTLHFWLLDSTAHVYPVSNYCICI